MRILVWKRNKKGDPPGLPTQQIRSPGLSLVCLGRVSALVTRVSFGIPQDVLAHFDDGPPPGPPLYKESSRKFVVAHMTNKVRTNINVPVPTTLAPRA
jgi:hypothetical protein